jgi:hypothetical protein
MFPASWGWQLTIDDLRLTTGEVGSIGLISVKLRVRPWFPEPGLPISEELYMNSKRFGFAGKAIPISAVNNGGLGPDAG